MHKPASRASLLLVLDVDGTIARLYSPEERAEHADDSGWSSWMTIDDEVIDAIDLLTARTGVRVAWLTTWTPDQVNWLIKVPLRGRITGPYVPHENWPRPRWRRQSLVSFVRRTRPAGVIWADDRLDDDIEMKVKAMTEIPTMVIRPNKLVGLRLEDVAEITRFVDELERA